MNVISLRLYVTGQTRSAQKAIAAAEDLGGDLGDRMTLQVIDVLDDSAAALNDDIYATPTIVRVSPEPAARLFGDLSRKETLIEGLGL